MSDHIDFERGARLALQRFVDPSRAPKKAKPISRTRGYVIKLAVRSSATQVFNDEFVWETDTISKLQARQEAERAAAMKGLRVVYVIDASIPEDDDY